MDAQHLPLVIGVCPHCGLPLYAGAPVHTTGTPDELELAHVACQRDVERRAR